MKAQEYAKKIVGCPEISDARLLNVVMFDEEGEEYPNDTEYWEFNDGSVLSLTDVGDQDIAYVASYDTWDAVVEAAADQDFELQKI